MVRVSNRKAAELGIEAAVPEAPKRRTKYGNVRTEYEGRTYDSRAEAERAAQLDMLQRAGQIRGWEPQVTFRLGDRFDTYRVDFLVWANDGTTWAEDVKGKVTAAFRRNAKKWTLHGPCPLHVIYKGGKVEVIHPESRGS